MKKFSVLMSVYRREKAENLRECLDSILCQTLLPSEVVLVEDGPLTAELYDTIKQYSSSIPNFKVVPLTENGGLGNALSIGLDHCVFEIVARMDTDDVNYPTRFEEEINVMMAHPEIDVVGAWIEEFNDKENVERKLKKVPEFQDEIYRYGKQRNPINHPVVMFRKKAVKESGGYQTFPLFEDYYLWVRLLLHGAKFYNIQRPLLHFRRTADMIRRRGGLQYAMNEVAFQRRIHDLGYISTLRMYCNIMQRFGVRLAPASLRSWMYNHLLR